MDQCKSCGKDLQENPRVLCSCGDINRNIKINISETCEFSNSGNLTISSFLSKRNISNTSLSNKNKLTKDNLDSFLKNKTLAPCNSNGLIYFHDSFMNDDQNGDINLGKIIDLKNICGNNLTIFNKFLQDVDNCKLNGRNKPSHNDNSSHELYPNYWHYHCGPYRTNKNARINNLFSKNLDGDTSSPVIHYIQEKEKIIIVAFATEHTDTFKDKSKIEETIKF